MLNLNDYRQLSENCSVPAFCHGQQERKELSSSKSAALLCFPVGAHHSIQGTRLAQKKLLIPISGMDKAHQPYNDFTWTLYCSTNILTARFVILFLPVQTHLCYVPMVLAQCIMQNFQQSITDTETTMIKSQPKPLTANKGGNSLAETS